MLIRDTIHPATYYCCKLLIIIRINTCNLGLNAIVTRFISTNIRITNHIFRRSNKFYGRRSDLWSALWLTVSLAHWIKIELIWYCKKTSVEMPFVNRLQLSQKHIIKTLTTNMFTASYPTFCLCRVPHSDSWKFGLVVMCWPR